VNNPPRRVLCKAPGRRPRPCAAGAQEAIRRGAFLRQPSSLKGKCDLAMVLATAAEIAAGMAFLHARGIIHGDLSAGAAPAPLPRARAPGRRGGRAVRSGDADRLRCKGPTLASQRTKPAGAVCDAGAGQECFHPRRAPRVCNMRDARR